MPSWWKRIALATAAVAGITGLAGGTYYLLTRRPLSKNDETLYLTGLHEQVEIITDAYGVPHIYANNEDDLYFAQGYVHARERLWQMEMNRRLISGRLSEIVGSVALEVDRFSRRLGMHRSATAELQRLPAHEQRVLEAYARGVNVFIERNSHRLPIEFTLLRIKPEPWQPVHTIQWAKLMAWNLGGNWETELIRARLVAQVGVERAMKLEAGYDPTHPLIIPPGVAYQGINTGLLEQYQQIKQLSGFGMMGASNNWVVDGTKSNTGAPILCNDPHLGQAAPSIWFECHLVSGDVDVVGVSFPGSPGIIIGHNQHIAWGVTNAISDVEDLYIEKFNPDNPHQYEYQGTWEDAQIVREEIVVKGVKEPVVEEVRITRHGPILTHMPPLTSAHQASENAPELPLAIRWVGLDQCKIISSIFKLNRATNWEEFRTAMRDWDIPPQNVVYADRNGNIGYIMAGAIPIRAHGQGLLPSPGWTGDYEWIGQIPFEELPQIYNPEQHFIVTANNRVIDDNYPHYITHEWLNGYRAQRIRDLLTQKEHLSLADMATIQADQYALPARAIVPHMLRIAAKTELASAAQRILGEWDYVLSPESVGATLYTTFLRKLEYIVFSAVLGSDQTFIYNYLGVGDNILAPQNGYASRSKPLLIRLLNEQDDSWFATSEIANGPKNWHDALEVTLQATLEELQERLGNDITRWEYGAVHKMSYNHPLGAIKPLDRLFNRGPFPVGGDIDTVNMGASMANAPETVITVPSFRQIVDLANLRNSLSIHAPGQSGHPASHHYDDFIPLWRAVKHHPMLFERAAIENNAEGMLLMYPN